MIVAVVPMKPLGVAKGRLMPVLPARTRRRLAKLMLSDVLAACRGVPAIARTYLMTADASLHALAGEHGADVMSEGEPAGLNAAMRAAAGALTGAPGHALLYVAGDLPLARPEDLIHLIGALAARPAMVIAPSRDDRGTNALLLSPPGLVAPSFGRDSFARHVAAARSAGAAPVIVRSEGLGLDIDSPDDLRALRAQRPDDERYAFLDAFLEGAPATSAEPREEVDSHA